MLEHKRLFYHVASISLTNDLACFYYPITQERQRYAEISASLYLHHNFYVCYRFDLAIAACPAALPGGHWPLNGGRA